VALPADAQIRPFVVKQTMPIRSKSNLMFNFVALASENPWLETLDVDGVNTVRHERLQSFRPHTRPSIDFNAPRRAWDRHSRSGGCATPLWSSPVCSRTWLEGLSAKAQSRPHGCGTGEFWGLDTAAREAVAPEVHQLKWVDLHDAFAMTLSTMNNAVTYIDDFQREQFAIYGIKRRDPMFMTAVTLAIGGRVI
jgi:hypothetical protein